MRGKNQQVVQEFEKDAQRSVPVKETNTVEEAGDRLGISRPSAYEAVRKGEIPTIRIGRRILVPTAWLDRVLKVEPA
jgi:excisionase family DNA binding protein